MIHQDGELLLSGTYITYIQNPMTLNGNVVSSNEIRDT